MPDQKQLDISTGVTLDALWPRLRTYLPGDLAARLDKEITSGSDSPASTPVLVEVIDTLQALHNNLGTYLPHSLVLANPTPGNPHAEFLEGTVLFVDVTGFTPLAERLRALGEEGAERLNRMINDLFTALLDPLYRSGGELLIFAGDAMQAYFPARPGAQDAIWATRAGLCMARAIEPFAQSPTPLTVSVGLARGRFFAAQVGTMERMEYLVTGGPIQQAMKAEAKAAPRQVSLAPGLEMLLAPQFRMIPLSDGFHTVVDDLGDDLGDFESAQSAQQRLREYTVHDDDPTGLAQNIAAVLSDIEALTSFFPPNVLRRIVAHQRDRQFPGEHRLVAVMFVNLRGFEALSKTLGAEELARLTYWINRYFVEAQETLAGCGGLVTHVDPYEKGFTLLCPFGAPLADEDTPHRATAAALRLNEKLRLLNQDLQMDLNELKLSPEGLPTATRSQDTDEIDEFQLTHHIGITFGPIYTGQVGWHERREYVVVGDDVNLSARLMSKAQTNQILISGWVHDRVRQSFECHPLEPMKLKGKTKPVTVYAVERRVPASAWLREAAVGHPLVGRGEELASLQKALDALEKGQGGILTLVGETGMGKTRLVAELTLLARHYNIVLLAGRCLSYAQSNPYTPWIEALWRWFELDTAADKAERRARVYQALERSGLTRLAETFCALLGLPKPEAPAPMRPAHRRPQSRLDIYSILQERIAKAPPAKQDFHLMLAWRLVDRDPSLAADIPSMWEHLGQHIHPDHALQALFKEVAQQEKPVLFLIEDLQWADRSSWAPLVNLAQATSRYPILLLVTARLGQIENRWLAEVGAHPRVERLALVGLDPVATGKLANRLIMRIMAREATPELVSWLYERARGNPLFTSQLLYALAGADGLITDRETGRVTLTSVLPDLPLTVREIMLSRVDQLPEETRTVVKLASVIGDTIPWELLTHLAHQAAESDATRLMDHVEKLAGRSLLTPAPPASEFTFVHPLFQEAVYSSVPYAQRRKWHRVIADRLEQGDSEAIHQHLEALAYHYKHSDTPKRGVRYSRLAGDKARARQAWDEALDYYQLAIEITAQDSTLDKERSLAYEHLGDVYSLTGRYMEAASAYEGALIETSRPLRVEGKLGMVCLLGNNINEATERMERAWDELEPDDPLRPWLAAALGWLALRARPRDMVSVVGSGAAAIAWWRRGQRVAGNDTTRLALKEMMAGRIPPDYSRLVHLALDDSEERETQ